MLSSISRFLQRLGILPGSVRPAPPRIAMVKNGGGLAPAKTVRSDAAGARDARARSEEGVEPAMDGIPKDAVQRTPPAAASPGLPPVDPVKGAPPAEIGSRLHAAARPASHGGVPGEPRESAPWAGASATHDTIAGTNPAAEVQTGASVEARQGVAPENALDPSGYPSTNDVAPKAFEGSAEGLPFDVRDAGRHTDEPFLPFVMEAYGHSSFVFGKETAAGPSGPEEGSAFNGAGITAPRVASPSPTVDSRGGDRLPRASKPAGAAPRVPPRIADRPSVEEWADDELLTLPEAAALFWPAGPITTNTLRTAERDGTLTVTKVAGKFFTTPMAIRRMGVDEVGEKAKEPDRAEASPQALFQMKLAEAKKLGRERARPGRAANRPVVPAANGKARQ